MPEDPHKDAGLTHQKTYATLGALLAIGGPLGLLALQCIIEGAAPKAIAGEIVLSRLTIAALIPPVASSRSCESHQRQAASPRPC